MLPKKGTEVYIVMKSGAIYRGIYQWFKSVGGGRIFLTDVKCCGREAPYNWLVSPKYGMNRKYWISKVASINELDKKDNLIPVWENKKVEDDWEAGGGGEEET